MEPNPAGIPSLSAATKRFVRRLLASGENRVELLMLEVHEERQKLLQSLLLALVAAAFGLLAGVAFTGAIVVFFWNRSPLLALVILTFVYAAVAGIICLRLNSRQRNWTTLPATLDQLKKDRAGFEKILS